MRTILFLAIILPNFMGCNEAKDTGYSSGPRLCTMVGSFYTIKVKITSSDPLPPNLAFSFNGKEVDIDECTPKSFYIYDVYNPIKLNQKRTKVNLDYDLNLEDFRFYFPEGFEQPISSLLNLFIYSRGNCTDSPTQFQEISDIGISWEPVYANGEHCGVSSYHGESHIDL